MRLIFLSFDNQLYVFAAATHSVFMCCCLLHVYACCFVLVICLLRCIYEKTKIIDCACEMLYCIGGNMWMPELACAWQYAMNILEFASVQNYLLFILSRFAIGTWISLINIASVLTTCECTVEHSKHYNNYNNVVLTRNQFKLNAFPSAFVVVT